MSSDTVAIPPAIEARMVARETEILGKPPRLAPLADGELDDEAIAWVKTNSATFGNASDGPPKISATFRTFFRNFPLFRAQMGVYAHILVRNALNDRERELVIMRMLWLCGSPHPFGEHVKAGRQAGMTQAELIGVLEGPDAPVWTDAHERAILRGVDELHERQAMTDETWATLSETWTDKQLIEMISSVGQYFSSACLHNAVRTRPADTNRAYRELEA